MIRGPMLPLSREGLWRLLQQRPELLERGWRLAAENLEVGTEGLGAVEGLMRDAAGAPVLVFATDDRDSALPARVLAASAFWRRNRECIPRALPEADLRPEVPCRLVVVGVGLAAEAVEALQHLRVSNLEIVLVERFHVAGQERLVCRPVRGALGAAVPPPIDDSVGEGERGLFAAFDSLLAALDPRIRVDGDRFSRRATFEGRPLGDCWFAEQRVHGAVPGGAQKALLGASDLRALGDLMARRYLELLGEAGKPAAAATGRAPATAGARRGLDALRASLSSARLSHEETSAFANLEREGDEEEPLTGG